MGHEVAALVFRSFCSNGARSGHLLRHGRRVFRKTHFAEGAWVDLRGEVEAMSLKGGDSGPISADLTDV